MKAYEGTIYALTDPSTGEIRYVGKTGRSPEQRRRDHVCASRRSNTRHVKLGRWLRSLTEKPGLVLLEEGISDPTALNSAERRWIAEFRATGVRLLNVLDGGDGWTLGRPQTAESIRKRNETLKRNGKSPAQKRAWVKARKAAMTPEARAKANRAIGLANLGRPCPHKHKWTPSDRARLVSLYRETGSAREARAIFGCGQNAAYRILHEEGVIDRGAWQRGRPVSAETRARISVTKRSRASEIAGESV